MYGRRALQPGSARQRGSMRGRSVGALAVFVLLVGGALAIPIDPALGYSADRGRPVVTGSITVAAVKDYGYQPDTFQQEPTNATITVTFTDDDVLQHSFTISSREGFVIPTTYTPTQLTQLFTTYPALFSALVNGSGDQTVGTFHSPSTPGWYEFVCNVSGHFENGMYGFVAFGEDLPSNLTSTPRVGLGGTNITPLDAAVIAAIFLVLVLGLVVWYRRRSARRLPRESGRPGKPGSDF
jgi:plastocyanin